MVSSIVQATATASFLLVVFVGEFTASAQNQRAVLYDQANGQGNYVVLPETYIDDLGKASFDNRARSVCVTGIWLFYQDISYNNAGGRAMEYVFGRDNYCVNFLTIGGTVSSARYAGSPKDYRTDSLTLYKYDYFQGQEEYILNQAANLNLIDNHQSIIITGNAHWTIFDQPSYRGNSVCLLVPDPGSSTPAFLSNLESIPGVAQRIPHGSIRSVRKGCVNQFNNVTLQAFSDGKNAFEPRSIE